MIKHNQDGAVSGVGISLGVAVVFLIAAIAFGGWAYMERQDYKLNSDQKAAAAAEKAKQEESKRKDAVFAEEIKNPFKTYSGPEAYGSLHLEYPKTWSGYVDATGTAAGDALIDGYFAPGEVPAKDGKDSVFAVRVQVLNKTYSEVLKNLESAQRDNRITVAAYALPKMPKTVGVMVNGQVTEGKTVTMVILPLRSEAVQIWTEGTNFLDDFNKNILPNFTFSP